MINLDLPEKLLKIEKDMRGFAMGLLRQIARRYDQNEHEYPKELDVLRPKVESGQPRAEAKKENKTEEPKAEKKDDKKEDKPKAEFGANVRQVMTVEQMCYGDAGLTLTIPNAGLGNAAISAVGTDDQKLRFWGKWASMAITEPGSGSDSGSITTTAVLDGDEWVLNGEKIFVTCADRCDLIVVWATVDKKAGKAGIKSFVVEKGTPGCKLEKLEHKLGIRASDTGTFVFTDCRIPKDNILGSAEVKDKKTTAGFKGVMKTFDNTRPVIAAMANGVAKASLDFTKEELEKSGVKLDYHKNPNNETSIKRDIYFMEANFEVMRLLALRAAWMADNKEHNSVEASMAKAKSGRAGTFITQKCCDILGPMGYSQKYLAEKWMRDSKIMDIFEGTGEIQHLIVARGVLGLTSKELR